ncbi:hypothetical protein RB620_04530 [Paenibacillus sp. LHD-117]|uniref:hypothetical protein n=1 Tax=Paenibacillus sp. LHD-117 TaxID=3071412 RepID=UPI0027E14578|nr:hypothetical protein [Paenibacillus sp. LHD-117]MDQ6418699.1 hypothetical protein [Paenibacillus sp. LHD-117]
MSDAVMAGQAAKHNLKIVRRHPERMVPGKRQSQEAYLKMLIRFTKEEKKNARRQGRTSLKSRLRNLIAFIITHPRKMVKE